MYITIIHLRRNKMLENSKMMSKSTEKEACFKKNRSFDVGIATFGFVKNVAYWNYSNVNTHLWRLYWNPTKGAILESGAKRIEMGEDSCVLIPPYTTFTTSMVKPFSHLYIHFSAPTPFDHVKREIFILPAEKCGIAEYGEKLSCDWTEPAFSLRIRMLIYKCFLELPEDCFLPEEKVLLDPRVKRAIDIMSSEVGLRHDCKEICRRIGMPLNSFYALFRKETGMTSKSYQLSLRMEKALTLLLHTNDSIKEIAEKTAFSDRYHFSKVFKAFFHVSPVAYRKKYGGRE